MSEKQPVSKLQEKRNDFAAKLEQMKKEKESAVQRLQQINIAIEQLNGAVYALDELAKAEAAPAPDAKKAPKLKAAPAPEEEKK